MHSPKAVSRGENICPKNLGPETCSLVHCPTPGPLATVAKSLCSQEIKVRKGRLGFVTRCGFALVLLAGCAVEHAVDPSQTAREPETGPALPLRSLRLYDVGIGYFERRGQLEGLSSTRLPVPVAHVDDALKTLIVLSDSGKVQVSGIEFGSVLSDSLARVLAGIPVGTSKAIRYVDVLTSLRGLAVKVQFKDNKRAALQGTLLEVSPLERVTHSAETDATDESEGPHTRTTSAATMAAFELSVLSDEGALVRFTTEVVEALYPRDPNVTERLDLAASTLAKRSAQLERGLRIEAKATGPIRIGYMAETPVWRASYRLVLPDTGNAALQGWALLHNDTDEAWRDIAVELINGRPDSFLFPLAAPRYRRRELAEPSEQLSTAPQLSRNSADQMWGDFVEADPEEGEGESLSGIGEGGGGRGEGIGMGSIGTLGHGSAAGEFTTDSNAITIGNLASIVPAAGEEGLTLYSYNLGTNVNIRAHGSALVPFLGEQVDAQRITWFSAGVEEGRSASIVVNNTNKTLPPGVLAVFERSGFVGETSLDRLKPGERQLLQFAYDLDMKLSSKNLELKEQTKTLRYESGALERHFLRTRRVAYSLANRGALPRVAHVLLGIVDNAQVQGADALDYHKGEGATAVLKVPARSTREVELNITEALRDTTSLSTLDSASVAQWLADGQVTTEQKNVLLRARAVLATIDATLKELIGLNKRWKELETRRDRLAKDGREMSAKEEVPEGLVHRLLEVEDAMTASDEQRGKLEEQMQTQRQALADVLEDLNPPEPAR
jgi:hypothetical protein